MIVEVCRELASPAIELEIKELRAVGRNEGEESMVARPGVVGGAFEIADGWKQACWESLCKEGTDAVGLRCDDEQALVVVQNFVGDADKAVVNLGQERCPVRGCMWPSELHSALGMPLGREKGVTQLHLFGLGEIGEIKMQCEVADGGRCGGVVERHERKRGMEKRKEFEKKKYRK